MYSRFSYKSLVLAISCFLTANLFGFEPKVIVIALDGVRALEWEGKAKSDSGKPVPRAALFPELDRLVKNGTLISNMKISNPAGISLPAYSDIFAGKRQTKIINNNPPPENRKSQFPTLFEIVQKELKLPFEGVSIFSSWKPLCELSKSTVPGFSEDFFKSCGWEKGKYINPEVYEGSRVDADTFLELLKKIPTLSSRLTFVHFGDADEEGHREDDVKKNLGLSYGIYHYHEALKREDYYVGRLWEAIQKNPFYANQTFLIVTTDHGRDNYPDPLQWGHHGACRDKTHPHLCSGCTQVFSLIVGPGIKRKVVTTLYTHLDIAPTVLKLLGISSYTDFEGKVIKEVF